MRIKNKDIERFKDLINKSNNIVIVTHNNPDGDAVGSTSAICKYLLQIGKHTQIIFPNAVPHHFTFLLEGVDYHIAENEFKNARNILTNADLLLILDMNTLDRTGEPLSNVLHQLTTHTVLIDHHLQPSDFDVKFSAPHISSTCELVWHVLSKTANKKVFSKDISTCLYAGIMTDTGSLSFSCNDPNLYKVIACLLKSGIKANKLNQRIFDTYSFHRMQLLGYAISKKMVVFEQQKAAFIALSAKELNHFKYQAGDLEGVVNYCLKLESVDFCALLSERDKKIRMSFRSKDESIDVNKFARKYWNGGGHVMAAGGKSHDSLAKVVETLVKQIENEDFKDC